MYLAGEIKWDRGRHLHVVMHRVTLRCPRLPILALLSGPFQDVPPRLGSLVKSLDQVRYQKFEVTIFGVLHGGFQTPPPRVLLQWRSLPLSLPWWEPSSSFGSHDACPHGPGKSPPVGLGT